MTETAATTTSLLAIVTIAGQVGALTLLVGLLFFREKTTEFFAPVSRWIIPTALAASIGSVALTLVYSEIFGFAPCELCWWQRAFLYPIPVLFAVALIRHERRFIADYVLWLAIPGALVALYHHALQIGIAPASLCLSTPGAADCTQRFIFAFGYVTFPLMSFTLFALIGLVMVIRKRLVAH